MSKKIKLYGEGDCVQVTVWAHERSDFFAPELHIGLVLEAELVEMDGASGLHDSTCEWMYRVSISSGEIVEAWDYEIKPVNIKKEDYNIIVPQSHKEK